MSPLKAHEVIDKEKYLKHKGHICPYCSSKNIEATEPFQIDGDAATQGIKCNSCNKEWRDISTLQIVDVEEI